jgi:hypothetical protein
MASRKMQPSGRLGAGVVVGFFGVDLSLIGQAGDMFLAFGHGGVVILGHGTVVVLGHAGTLVLACGGVFILAHGGGRLLWLASVKSHV